MINTKDQWTIGQSEFKGYVRAKLEHVDNNIKDLHQYIKEHMEREEEKMNDLSKIIDKIYINKILPKINLTLILAIMGALLTMWVKVVGG